ncbi:tyrosine-type recombinase/integrase [Bifidobacterium sp. ESL0775]|uniref:tyrosine-type recombinase/integrase n=1 Tax=Bifidobacterium sp. ESL0775 TaxID=2983230 RepID=UPI0023F89032|nr:site-specific integrase [Bifidobacterium sp. ESL0775]WEV69477.1 tyrosine-type recombinase/integrase [Bifidobacterium sp. ESL0775]
MSSIEPYKTAKGEKRWRVRYRKPDHSSTDKRGFKRKRDAEDFLARLTAGLNDGSYIDPQKGRVTIAALGPEWLKGKSAVLKPSSYHALEVSWNKWVKPQWGRRAIQGIRKSEIQTWVSEIASERSASIVLRAHGVLGGILEMAKNDGMIRANPAEGLDLPRKKAKPRHYLDAQQVIDLANECGEYRPLVLVLGFCGLRWGEAIGLVNDDIDFAKNRIHVRRSATRVAGKVVVGSPKSGKGREVPMPRIVAESLQEACKGKHSDELVFTSPQGGYVKQQSNDRRHRGWFHKALDKLGIPPMTVHDLRHTAASIAVHNGANVKVLQRMLGHASAAMTLDRYADLFDKDLDDVFGSLDAEVSTIMQHAQRVD